MRGVPYGERDVQQCRLVPVIRVGADSIDLREFETSIRRGRDDRLAGELKFTAIRHSTPAREVGLSDTDNAGFVLVGIIPGNPLTRSRAARQ
jgi:hypothetical protein